ncbi:MAG: pyridoxamine 5'-phosphate oxidase family protein [Promethearchaeota archaeon]
MDERDLDSKEIIFGSRKKLEYNTMMSEILEELDQNKEIVLATSYNNRVTARTISFTNDKWVIYFMSWDHNKKVKQIEKNPKVALCLKNIQIEGEAQILKDLSEEMYKKYLEIFKKKFSDIWISTFSRIKEMVMVKVVPSTIVKFENINRRFYLQTIDITKKIAFQMRLEDKDNPNFPY